MINNRVVTAEYKPTDSNPFQFDSIYKILDNPKICNQYYHVDRNKTGISGKKITENFFLLDYILLRRFIYICFYT